MKRTELKVIEKQDSCSANKDLELPSVRLIEFPWQVWPESISHESVSMPQVGTRKELMTEKKFPISSDTLNEVIQNDEHCAVLVHALLKKDILQVSRYAPVEPQGSYDPELGEYYPAVYVDPVVALLIHDPRLRQP